MAKRPASRRRTLDAGPDERQRILDAAERAFARRGFEETKMQDIAAEARVSLRSVYGTASGKAVLHLLVQETRARDLLARIERVLSVGPSDSGMTGDQRDRLLEVIEVVATFLMEHPDFLRIQLREGGTWAMDESRRIVLIEERHESDRLLERLFRDGIAAGVFFEEDPRLMVASLRGLEQVHLAAWIARLGRRSKRATIEAIQRQAERLFFAR